MGFSSGIRRRITSPDTGRAENVTACHIAMPAARAANATACHIAVPSGVI
jgi:hypothetical protein